MRAALASILMCVALAGCARQIVATPEQAETQNDLDWTIGSAPRLPDASADAGVDADEVDEDADEEKRSEVVAP